jgi:hypothetical protein
LVTVAFCIALVHDLIVPCDQYRDMKSQFDQEMSVWAQFSYPQNRHLQGGVSERKAKEIARDARKRADEKAKAMHAHTAHCEECKRES